MLISDRSNSRHFLEYIELNESPNNVLVQNCRPDKNGDKYYSNAVDIHQATTITVWLSILLGYHSQIVLNCPFQLLQVELGVTYLKQSSCNKRIIQSLISMPFSQINLLWQFVGIILVKVQAQERFCDHKILFQQASAICWYQMLSQYKF